MECFAGCWQPAMLLVLDEARARKEVEPGGGCYKELCKAILVSVKSCAANILLLRRDDENGGFSNDEILGGLHVNTFTLLTFTLLYSGSGGGGGDDGGGDGDGGGGDGGGDGGGGGGGVELLHPVDVLRGVVMWSCARLRNLKQQAERKLRSSLLLRCGIVGGGGARFEHLHARDGQSRRIPS